MKNFVSLILLKKILLPRGEKEGLFVVCSSKHTLTAIDYSFTNPISLHFFLLPFTLASVLSFLVVMSLVN